MNRNGRTRAVARKFLIVQTGNTLPAVRRRHGDFPGWFQRGLGLHRNEIVIVRAHAGETLPDPRSYAGAIVTGSPSMVSERLGWSEATARWLREAIPAGLPILGVCYGHQLLAHALGGRVDYHANGREIGTVAIERLPTAADDALMDVAPTHFRAHASHRQSVLELPTGAVVLAGSAHDPHHAVRYAARVWGLQFHPEFSVEIMRSYLQARSSVANGDCPGPCCRQRGHAPAPVARRLLRRFRQIAFAGPENRRA
jgi:GMP synthase (glutamine-hydrolysing)